MADANNSKTSYLLVTIYHGENFATPEMYTDSPSDLLGHLATPTLEVDLAENGGEINQQESKVLMPIDEFLEPYCNGVVAGPLKIKVVEVSFATRAGLAGGRRTLFAGSVKYTTRNYQGRRNVVCLHCVTAKSQLDVESGITCDPQCAWTVFKGGCGANQAAFEEGAEIDSRDGQTVVITDAGAIAKTGTYWRRGYILRDGLAIGIRDWSDADPTVFYLTRGVPEDWVLAGGDSVLLVPGCDGHIETCRDVFNQEETFMGMGYKMPDHQPNTETPF